MSLKNIHRGQFKRKIVLKQPVSTRNSEGGKMTTYTSLPEIRAKIERTNQQRAIEIAPALLNTEVIHFDYTNDRALITLDWLITFDGLDHTVQSIEFLGQENKEFIKLIVKAKNG